MKSVQMTRLLSVAVLVLMAWFYPKPLLGESVDVVGDLKKEAANSKRLKWISDRLGNAESGFLLRGEDFITFPLELSSNGTLLEMWLRPDEWHPEGGALLEVSRPGSAPLTLRKEKGEDILAFRDGNTVLGRIPVDHWGRMDWIKDEDPRLWHHAALHFINGEVRLFMDGFLVGRAKADAMMPGETTVTLSSPGTISYAGIFESVFENESVADFRKRYLNLFRNVPAIEAPLVTVPKLDAPPNREDFLASGEFPGATNIPGMLAWKSQKEKSAYPSSTLLQEGITVFLARDAEKLYLAFRSPYAGKLAGAARGGRDKSFWDQECFEVFLEPPWTGVSEYVQLVGTAYGDQADLQLMNPAWDGSWTWQTKILDGEWRGIMAVDLKGSGLPIPGSGDIWGFNLFNLWANAAWSWSLRFHDSAAFGKMQFLDNAPPILWGAPIVKDGRLTIPVWLGGPLSGSRALVSLQRYAPGKPLPEEEVSLSLEDSSMKQIQIPYQEGTEALFVLQARLPDGRLLYNQNFALPTASALQRPIVSTDAPQKSADSKEAEPEWSAEELGQELQESREWFGNSIGKMEGVPAGLRPLQITKGTVSLWNRQYDLEGALFLRQATSNARELLAEPVRLQIKTRKGEHSVGDAETSVVSETPREALIVGETETAGLSLRVESRVSFDGLIWYELRVAPSDKPVEIESLHLQVPMRRDQAGLLNLTSSLSGHPPGSDSGAMPQEPMILDFLREIIWMGTPREGLTWLIEDLRGWPIRDERAIQSITPSKDAVVLDVKLGEDFILKEPVTFRFGMQATPVRERAKDFRRLADKSAVRWSWFWGEGDYYPFHDDPKVARGIIAKERAEGREVMPASSVHFFGTYRFDIPPKPFPERPHGGLKHRENLLFEGLWAANSMDVVDRPPGILPATQTPAGNWRGMSKPIGQNRNNPASSFQDFYLWKLDREVRETGLGAIYLDQPLMRVSNPLSGAGYAAPDGTWKPSVPLLGMRSMLERMYNVFQKAHGKSLIRWHSSNQMIIPVFPYIDIFWDGENYGHSRSKVFEFYSKLLSPEKMQVQHTGLPFGFAPSLLPEFESRYAPSPASVRDMMGLFLIHDSHVWNSHSDNLDIVTSITQKWLDFPYEEAVTHYYWDEDMPLKINAPDVRAILHRTDKRGRLILFNWSDETREVTSAFTEKGMALRSVMDAETGGPVPHTDNALSVLIPPRDFRMYDFEYKK